MSGARLVLASLAVAALATACAHGSHDCVDASACPQGLAIVSATGENACMIQPDDDQPMTTEDDDR